MGVIWTKRGRKFSNRSSGIQTESLSIAILTINDFQKEDLGIYVCKAKAINSAKYNYKGEKHQYLLASQLEGFDLSEQALINPDINVQVECDNQDNESEDAEQENAENACTNDLVLGESLLLRCHIENFGTSMV